MPFSDLIDDSRLETCVHGKYTVHIYCESDSSFGARRRVREEWWKRKHHLGQGSYGTVWFENCVKGKDGEHVRAVKEIRKSVQSVQALDFHRELEAMAKFSHRRYVHCFVESHGWYEHDNALFIAMEYLQGGDLHEFLRSSPGLPEADAQQISYQILEGLGFMHQNGFIHRDLKPRNILIKDKPPQPWWIKIGDFGISKRAGEASNESSTIKGTLEFMAPEVLGFTISSVNESASVPLSVKQSVDLWALGIMTFQMLTQRVCFKDMGKLGQFARGEREFPVSILKEKGVGEGGVEFITSLVSPVPASRPSAQQASQHSWLESQRTKTSRPPSIFTEESESTGDDSQRPSIDLEEASAAWSIMSDFGHETGQTAGSSSRLEPAAGNGKIVEEIAGRLAAKQPTSEHLIPQPSESSIVTPNDMQGVALSSQTTPMTPTKFVYDGGMQFTSQALSDLTFDDAASPEEAISKSLSQTRADDLTSVPRKEVVSESLGTGSDDEVKGLLAAKIYEKNMENDFTTASDKIVSLNLGPETALKSDSPENSSASASAELDQGSQKSSRASLPDYALRDTVREGELTRHSPRFSTGSESESTNLKTNEDSSHNIIEVKLVPLNGYFKIDLDRMGFRREPSRLVITNICRCIALHSYPIKMKEEGQSLLPLLHVNLTERRPRLLVMLSLDLSDNLQTTLQKISSLCVNTGGMLSTEMSLCLHLPSLPVDARSSVAASNKESIWIELKRLGMKRPRTSHVYTLLGSHIDARTRTEMQRKYLTGTSTQLAFATCNAKARLYERLVNEDGVMRSNQGIARELLWHILVLEDGETSLATKDWAEPLAKSLNTSVALVLTKGPNAVDMTDPKEFYRWLRFSRNILKDKGDDCTYKSDTFQVIDESDFQKKIAQDLEYERRK